MGPALSKSINVISAWLEDTWLSQAIQATDWVVPTVQTVHILAIAVIAGSVLMIDLRLIGVMSSDQPFKNVSSRFLPFVWWALLVLLTTGAIMIIGEPPRSLKNPAFQLKMALLLAAILVTGLIQILLRRDPAFGEVGSRPHGLVTVIAVLSVLLWTGIICAGRWIAYYS